MTHCFRAALTSTPLIKCSDLFTPFKPVVTHHLHAVRGEKFMGSAPFVEVNVVPICHLKTMKSVPEDEFVVRIHWHFRQLVKIGRNFAICHRMGLSIGNGLPCCGDWGLYLSRLNRLRL